MPADGTATLCLNDIDGFEALTARMPTAEERERLGVPDGTPILVMRRHGRDQAYRADMVTVTIASPPPPTDPDEVRELIRAVLHHLTEDITNTADDLACLARSLGAPPPHDVAALAAELRLRRAIEYAGADVLEKEALASRDS